jgi:glycerol-3-phosphate acyltransferase PlsY
VTSLVAAIVGYLLGSIPFSVLAARRQGRDILQEGSGNPGATNALRVIGPYWAVAVLIGDAGKGILAAYLGWKLGGPLGSALAGAAAAVGHAYSIYLRGRGGKVVAVSLGVLLFWGWPLVVGALVVFGVVIALTRIVSISSMLAALAAAVLAAAGVPALPPALRFAVFFLVLLLLWRHRPNIERLLRHEEKRLGSHG